MKMPRPTDEDKARFRNVVTEAPGVQVRPMFGSLGAFVDGAMFAGLFGSDIGVKLDEDSRTALAAIEGSGPFGPTERPMGGYLSLPASFTDEEAAVWVERAREYVAMLPPRSRSSKRG